MISRQMASASGETGAHTGIGFPPVAQPRAAKGGRALDNRLWRKKRIRKNIREAQEEDKQVSALALLASLGLPITHVCENSLT